MRAAFDLLINVDVPAAAADLDAAFRDNGSDMDLSAFLHTRGINMRYLPQVATGCRNPAARQYLEQEAVIRAAKHKIRALWAERAESDAHAAAIAADVMQRLRRGDRDLWSQLQPDGGAPSWAWERRLRAAIGLKDDSTLTPKIKNVRPPPFVPLDRQERALLKDLEFRRATSADVLPVQFQLIALYIIWAAGDDPRDSFAKGEAVLKQVLERHRRGPPVENAVSTAANWFYKRAEFGKALPFYEELLKEQRARVGPDHHAVAATLSNIGTVHHVRASCLWISESFRCACMHSQRAITPGRSRISKRRCASKELRWARSTTRWPRP